MISLSDIKNICDQYGLGQFLGIESITEGVLNENYIITTDAGKYFIKSIRTKSQAIIANIYEIEVWMKLQGIPAIVMLKTSAGEIYVKGESDVYSMYPYLESDRSHKYSKEDYKNMGVMLGNIHKAGSKIPASLEIKNFGRPKGDVIIERLNGYKKLLAEKVTLDDIDKDFLEYIDFKIEAISKLEVVDLPSDTLTHGDYQTGNILIDAKTREIIGICDWEKAEFAPRAYELARAIFYICFEGGFVLDYALNSAREILSGYNSVYPISKDELIKGLKMRIMKMACSAWIEDMHYNQGSTRADKFIKSEMRTIEMAKNSLIDKILSGVL